MGCKYSSMPWLDGDFDTKLGSGYLLSESGPWYQHKRVGLFVFLQPNWVRIHIIISLTEFHTDFCNRHEDHVPRHINNKHLVLTYF